MSIQAIDSSSIHSLTSGQVVIDLQTAVKELVENALDAGATSIDVKFREHGVESIEVQDNGKGIDKDDWPGIALKHHTSKLSSFADLASVSTLGFRGEALSSLCGTASLSLVTSTASTAPVGTSLSFKRNGECVVGTKVARAKGTTIKVERLFEALPVRRKELIKNAKREFGKALELLQAYALVSSGVRFEVKNTTKSKTMTHLQAPASPSLRSNFSSIFAPKSLQTMMDLDLALAVEPDKSVLRWTEGSVGTTEVRVKGLVSKPSVGNGRTSGSRQFFYINGRPFHPTKIAKAVNEVYKSFVPGSFPTIVADFQLATDAYDVNVSPDKRTIFLHSEGNLIAALKSALEEFYRPSQSTFEMTQIGAPRKSSQSAPTVQAKEINLEDSPSSQEGPGDGSELDGVGERPKKKRKIGGEDDGSVSDGEAPPTEGALLGTGADMEIDAGMFASSECDTLPLDPQFDTSEQSFELPTPPSPIVRAIELEKSRLSSPSRCGGPASVSSSPGPRHSPVASTSRISPVLSDDEPLFRPLPSPTPALRESRSPSRTPSPSSPERTAPNKLRQPKLSFGRDPIEATVETKRDRKGKGRADQNGLHSMRNLLQEFVRPGGSTAPFRVPIPEDGKDGTDEDGGQASEDYDEDEIDEGEDSSRLPDGNTTTRDLTNRSQILARHTEETASQDSQDDLEVVEDSFQSAKGQADEEEDETADDEIEVISASCVCVHGSPDEEDIIAIRGDATADQPPPAITPFGGAPAEVAGTFVAADTELELDFPAIESAWSNNASTDVALSRHCEGSPGLSTAEEHDELVGAGLGESDAAAEATLSRVVSKDDFEAMEVVGQFNLGFIIARRKVQPAHSVRTDPHDVHDDLFIIDQHASDEKYNFEKLQAETVIQSQRLLAPRVLNLPSHDEITAIEHLDLLRLNGYDVVVDEDADVGERVKLLAQPVSNKTVFDIADFEELLDLIGSRAGNEIVRPSKTRKMFASRACRKSVMIGKALNSNQMTSIIRHMGAMDQPWACPHGRPTMRWLAGLGSVSDPDSRSDLAGILAAYDREGTAP